MKAEVLVEVKNEVEKMLEAGFIRPCKYAEWISSVVPVKKKDGRWQVCVDFRDLNRGTPKDEYPMPIAETLINAAAGHKILSFMDGNAGYNQIFMAPEDVHKTAFRVPGAVGLFKYVVMTFGLKNAGATYQCAMNYIFHELIGWMEIYIDDVMVKSVSVEGHYHPGKDNVVVDALSRKSHCHRLSVEVFNNTLYWEMRKLNLEIVPQGSLNHIAVEPILQEDPKGILRFNGRMVVPKNPQLRK
jgi:hypothetical protein